jgi:hypothetical protein
MLVLRLDSLKYGTYFASQILSYLRHLIEYNDITILCDHQKDLAQFTQSGENDAKGDKNSQKNTSISSEKSLKIEEKI